MISVYQIKPAFQKLLQPLLNFLFKIGITANQITAFSILFSAGLGFMFLQHKTFNVILLLLPLGLLIRMALNALDGMMAKQFNMQSKLGEVLNEMGDITSDLFIILPFIILPQINEWIIILFAILTILNEFSGILAKSISGERRYDGPMGKSDRALFIGLFCIVYFFWDGIELYVNWIFGLASILVIFSTFIRLKKAVQ
jgi:CDP-diacylglycerol--glycerol-3-phosphate 3-phosphatidyltransferase